MIILFIAILWGVTVISSPVNFIPMNFAHIRLNYIYITRQFFFDTEKYCAQLQIYVFRHPQKKMCSHMHASWWQISLFPIILFAHIRMTLLCNTYMHIYTCTYIHACVCLCVCVYVYACLLWIEMHNNSNNNIILYNIQNQFIVNNSSINTRHWLFYSMHIEHLWINGEWGNWERRSIYISIYTYIMILKEINRIPNINQTRAQSMPQQMFNTRTTGQPIQAHTALLIDGCAASAQTNRLVCLYIYIYIYNGI